MNRQHDAQAVVRCIRSLQPKLTESEILATRLAPFGNQTIAQLVVAGRADTVMRYVESIGSGFIG